MEGGKDGGVDVAAVDALQSGKGGQYLRGVVNWSCEEAAGVFRHFRPRGV